MKIAPRKPESSTESRPLVPAADSHGHGHRDCRVKRSLGLLPQPNHGPKWFGGPAGPGPARRPAGPACQWDRDSRRRGRRAQELAGPDSERPRARGAVGAWGRAGPDRGNIPCHWHVTSKMIET